MKKKSIEKLVYDYPTRYEEGFIREEIDELLKQFPKIHKNKFYDALRGITCVMRDGKLVIYHCDILRALHCGLENRNLTLLEWD